MYSRVMGSASTNMAGHFGGFEGRGLRKGDLLGVRKGSNSRVSNIKPGAVERVIFSRPVRVTRGAQHDWFGVEAFGELLSCPYTVSEQSNRSGLRLQGESISPRVRSQLLTEGVSLGAIQVPQDEQPIILFVDQQTTGGYPKIANVISADLTAWDNCDRANSEIHGSHDSGGDPFAAGAGGMAETHFSALADSMSAIDRFVNRASIDINADMGESPESLASGADFELMRHITSASIACGGHAGDARTMKRTLEFAKELGVAGVRIPVTRIPQTSDAWNLRSPSDELETSLARANRRAGAHSR